MRKLLILLLVYSPAFGQQGLGLGYVLDNALPVLSAVNDADFNENISIGAFWKSFDNENAMIEALESGEIGLAIGVSPETFLDEIDAGANLQLVDIAAVYIEQWNCVLRSEIAESKAALFGLKIALPFGTGAEIVFQAQLDAMGGNVGSSILRDRASVDAAAALVRGDADIACGKGEALARMREYGVDLMAAEPTFALGPRWFSGVVTTTEFATDHPEVISGFIRQQQYLSGEQSAIALAADMGEIDAEAGLAAIRILALEDKQNADWFGGGLQQYLINLARLRAERGLFRGDIASIGAHVNPSFITAR